MGQLSLWTLAKECNRCGETKPIEAFRLRKNRHGNPCRTSFCIKCLNQESSRRYYEQRQRWLTQQRGYNLANREVLNAQRKARRLGNIEKERETGKRYYAANKERALARGQAWARANRERVNASQRRRRAANPAKAREKWRTDRLKDPEGSRERVRRRRAIKRALSVGTVTVALLRAKWAYWGGRCWMCGGEATEIDHVKPLARGGAHMLCNLRPACRACNAQKNARWPL